MPPTSKRCTDYADGPYKARRYDDTDSVWVELGTIPGCKYDTALSKAGLLILKDFIDTIVKDWH